MSDLLETKTALEDMGAIVDYANAHLERVGKSYVCPFCGSGSGPNRTPAFSIRGNRFKCFSCNASGDALDLVGKVEGVDGFSEKIRHLADACGVAIDVAHGRRGSASLRVAPEAPVSRQAVDHSIGRAKHRDYIEQMRANVDMPEAVAYITGRGFTMEEAHRLGFGYDPSPAHGWQDKGGVWHKSGRVVIPWAGSDYYHIDRAISPEAKNMKYDKPKSSEVGEQPLHNPDALEGDEVFLVEGLLDALALEVMGYHSIAVAGTGCEQTLRSAASRDYRGTLILMLDGDEPGRKAQAKAEELAEELRLDAYVSPGLDALGVKDACEALQKDREAARTHIGGIVESARAARDERAREAEAAALRRARLQLPLDVASAIFGCKDEDEPIPTGLRQLDTVTNGGLRPGLTALGATSSAGKTTLLVQIADTMASAGHPVLFVTIEQSAREIVGKSLSRLMSRRGYEGVGVWEMTTRSAREQWEDAKTHALFDAYDEYSRDVAPNLMIMSASEQPDVGDVRAAVAAAKRHLGGTPVVMVDYLQLLAPRDDRQSDKQAVDSNVSELRRLARDERTPVVVISSLNRASYSGQIEMESFKESGGIEYGADLLLGLQPYHMEEKLADVKGGKDKIERAAKDMVREFRRKGVRECELVVLKNRNGTIPPRPLPLTFYAASSTFVEGVIEGGE